MARKAINTTIDSELMKKIKLLSVEEGCKKWFDRRRFKISIREKN